MLINTIETNVGEMSELLSSGLFFYILFFGILPYFIFYNVKNIKIETLKVKCAYFVFSVFFLISLILLNGKNFALLRQNRELSGYLPPFNYTFGSVNAAYKKIRGYITKNIKKEPLISIIEDSTLINTTKPTLIIFLIGETTRAKNIGWNGYERNTMEFLESYKKDIINFSNWYSCNTSTFNSIPCMFGFDDSFSYKKILKYENYLHILKKLNFNLYWFSNNGGCKGVCEDAIPEHKIIKSPDGDDMELLQEVKKLELAKQNTIVYLHLRGSHGPEYYKRYPIDFEYYNPVCKYKEIRNCENQSIVNAYDNSVRYNMFVIAKIIDFLKIQEKRFNVALFFTADHGESLGENGFYLHAAPMFLVKDTQGHPASFLWMPSETLKNLKVDKQCLSQWQSKTETEGKGFSHFNIFHSIIGLFNIKNKYYNSSMDIFSTCRK
jgi:lipid A ethanolaminephosphotransferase